MSNKERDSQKKLPHLERVLIMAGGTGGHVFPAMTIAKDLQKEGVRVEWLGTKGGLEATLIPAAHIPIHYIAVTSWRREGLVKRFLGSFLLLLAVYQALKILKQFKPNLVIGLGGFASGPGGIAAWLLRIPLIIHEQNAVAGITNRILARFAKRVLAGFPGAFSKKLNAIWTGNPIREELTRVASPAIRLQNRTGPLRLLIIGGSQGASALNKLCPLAIALIPEGKRPEVWHQAGSKHEESTKNFYRESKVEAKVDSFIKEMDKAYDWADIVLCRAGALTIAELSTVGVGSILVPFPFAVDDHQTHNGRFLEAIGAAKLYQQKALDKTKLAEIIMGLSEDRELLLAMANAAKGAGKPRASLEVIEHCKSVLK